MAIIYNEKNRTFTLETLHSTYQMQADKYGVLLHLYYGEKSKGQMDYLLPYYDRGFATNINDAGADRTYSLDILPQEFPTLGTGDFRSPALIIQNADGSRICDLRYQSYQILEEKYAIPGLPAFYGEGTDAQTLEILLEDETSHVQAKLRYGVLPQYDVITRAVEIINEGQQEVRVEKLLSASLDYIGGDFDLLSFYGCHARERSLQRGPVGHTCQVICSRRGTSSHHQNPMMILARKDTNEDAGACWMLSLVYSGGFRGEVEQDAMNQTRIGLGLQEEDFSYPLESGESLHGPEAALTYSGQGLTRLSQNMHRCVRRQLCRGKYKEDLRPVLVNSWEGAFFDFDGETIYKLAQDAATLGLDMVVMDDGWFGKREDDTTGLGDWEVNEKKLGCSLGELVERVNSLGMKFGIWVEPEMISEDSNLYRQHPEWAFAIPGRAPVRSRSQLVLDFSRKDVVDYIYEKICCVLDEGKHIEYIKWDMNRSIANAYSIMAGKEQGRVLYDYVLGLYDFLERLVKRYPDMLLEGCSGGGGRFDLGMLYYTPQIWASDNTDAVDRVNIQYGTSFGYPVSAVGSHVSISPNQQTGRTMPLKTRGVTAMAGTFGYELNLGLLTQEEKEEVRQQIREYKRLAPLIQQGLYFRLTNPGKEDMGAWSFVSEDGNQVLVQAVTLRKRANEPVHFLRLKGLDREGMYREQSSGKLYGGGALMEAGLPLPIELGEYRAYQMLFEKVE